MYSAYVFREHGKQSHTRHTGLLLVNAENDEWKRADFMITGSFAGIVTRTLTGGDMTCMKFRNVENRREFKKSLEHMLPVSSDPYHRFAIKGGDAELKELLAPEKQYWEFGYNCRRYCVTILHRLRSKYFVSVDPKTEAFLIDSVLFDLQRMSRFFYTLAFLVVFLVIVIVIVVIRNRRRRNE